MLRILAKFLGFLITATVLIGFVMFASANVAVIHVDLSPFPYQFEVPQFLFAFLPFIVGLIIGSSYFFSETIKNRAQVKRQEKRISALENEVIALRLEEPEQQKRLHYLPPL